MIFHDGALPRSPFCTPGLAHTARLSVGFAPFEGRFTAENGDENNGPPEVALHRVNEGARKSAKTAHQSPNKNLTKKTPNSNGLQPNSESPNKHMKRRRN